jgi:hypothetical protein
MKMYLLLRNNKQSGPYSFDDLKSMGLKAYDLVWLEGKSAAWRYPSELEELSSFAPAVEEQPFDRFYKKPSPAATTANNVFNDPSGIDAGVSVRSTTEMPVAVEVETQSPRSTPMASPGKRIIYVTMPAGKSSAGRETSRETNREASPRETAVARETSFETAARESTVREMPVREPAFREPVTETHREIPVREPIVREMTPSYARAAIEDYSAQPADEQMSPVDYLPRRKSRKTSLKTRAITRFVAIGLCVLALLAAGIFIGLSLNKDTLGLQHKMVANVPAESNVSPGNVSNTPATNTEQPIVHPTAQQLPAPAVTSPSASTDQENPTVNNAAVPTRTVKTTPQTSGKSSPQSTGRTAKDRSAHGAVPFTTAPATKDSATATIPAMQREAVHRSDNAETRHENTGTVDKDALRAAVASQISVGANNYSIGTFGGISDLQVTVTNRSAYPLDLVVVEVQYVQANKKVFKTEHLYFHGIGTGSALMLEAPKSSRGIKVQYKVMTINSRELGLPGV